MNCHKARANLGRYLDGELSSDELRLLDRHLQQCSGCAGELNTLREVGTLLRRDAAPPVPPSLARNVVRMARAEQARAPFPSGWIGVCRTWSAGMRFAAAGSAALAVFVGLLAGGAGEVRRRGELDWLQTSSAGPVLAAYQGVRR